MSCCMSVAVFDSLCVYVYSCIYSIVTCIVLQSLEKCRADSVFGGDEMCLSVFFPRHDWEFVRGIVTAVQGMLLLAVSIEIKQGKS